jgi:APA family basic amino acid/polyamine antiporter
VNTVVLTGTFDSLVALASVLFVAPYLSGFVSLMVLRKKEPELSKPYQAWWYPWSTGTINVACLGFLIGSIIGELKHSAFERPYSKSQVLALDCSKRSR